jgi:hypothetical protein
MVTVAVALPPVLFAVTVYVVVLDSTVGVPEIVPVVREKESPVGSVGVIDQEVTAPPLDVGVAVCINVPFCKVKEFGVYVTEDGATSLTSIVTVTESEPPAFVAVIV